MIGMMILIGLTGLFLLVYLTIVLLGGDKS